MAGAITADGTDDYARVTSWFSASPFTCFMDFNVTTLNAVRLLAEVSDGSGSVEFFRLVTDTTNHMLAQVGAVAGNGASTSAGTFSAATWSTACHITSGIASRQVGLNGTLATANTTSRTPAGLTTLQFMLNIVNNQDLLGSISSMAFWSNALGSTEYTAFNNGNSPLNISPSTLTAYWQCADSATCLTDCVGGRVLTLGGNAAFSASGPTRAVYKVSRYDSGRMFNSRLIS